MDGNWEDENDEVVRQNALLLRRNSVQSNQIWKRRKSKFLGLFNGYHYDATEAGGAVAGMQSMLQKQSTHHQHQSFSSQSFHNSSQTTQTLSVSIDNKQ